MGYVPPKSPSPELNLDRHGMPKDYATYVWLLYRKHVVDDSPVRRAFLDRGRSKGWNTLPDFGQQMAMR